MTEGGTQQISYQAVAEVGGKYLVKCYISDVASPGYELMLGMNEEALIKELFTKKQLLEFFKYLRQEEGFLFPEKKVENQQKKCIAETEKEKAAHMDCRYKWTACIGISCRRDFYGTIL